MEEDSKEKAHFEQVNAKICKKMLFSWRSSASVGSPSNALPRLCSVSIEDFSYRPMQDKPATMSSSSSTDVYIAPQNLSTDPRKVLGLCPHVQNKDIINKRYRALALSNHPDKGGDTASFRRICEAFEKLIKEVSISNQYTEISQGDNIELFYCSTNKQYASLVEQRMRTWSDGYSNFLEISEKLTASIKAKLARRDESMPSIKRLLRQLNEKSQQFAWCCRMKIELDSLSKISESSFRGSVVELQAKISPFVEVYKGLKKLEIAFDLENLQNTWRGRHSHYQEACVYYLDKLIGVGRLIVQLYFAEGNQSAAMKLFEELKQARIDFDKRQALYFHRTESVVDEEGEGSEDWEVESKATKATETEAPKRDTRLTPCLKAEAVEEVVIPHDAVAYVEESLPKAAMSHSQMLQALLDNAYKNTIVLDGELKKKICIKI